LTEPNRVIRIERTRGLFGSGSNGLWRYRELFFFFVWRDLKVRYRQTFFGVGWAVIQPLLMMIVLSVILGRFVEVPSDGLPYPLFAYAGLVPWSLFSRAMVGASDSLVESSQLIRKVYFPRLMLPLASGASYILDFAVAMTVLVGMMVYYGVRPGREIIALPFLALSVLVVALAVGVWLAAINVRYRDVKLAIPFIVQVWLFATPVAYPSSLFPDRWRFILGLNPVAGVVEGFRWSLLGGPPPGPMLAVSLGVAVMLLVVGFGYFGRSEHTFADWI
jgi:lipopolysaccharide transport system permease protein